MSKIINVFGFYSIVLALLLISTTWFRQSSSARKFLYAVSVFVLVIFFGFRELGLDLEPYKEIYAEFGEFNFDDASSVAASRLEPIHILMISTLKSNGFEFDAYLFMATAIPILIISYVLWRTDSNPLLSLYFFMLTIAYPAMDAVRHFFAAAIYFAALYVISKGKIASYLQLSLISSLAHYSNIITAFLFPVLRLKWSIASYSFFLVLSVILAYALSGILALALPEVASDFDSSIFFKLNYYVNHADAYEYVNSLHFWIYQARIYFYIFIVLCMNFYVLTLGLNVVDDRSFHLIVFNSQVIGSFFSVFFICLGAIEFAMRINFLLSIGSFLLLKDIVVYCPKGRGTDVTTKFIAVNFLLFIYNFIALLYLAGVHQPASPFYLD